MQSSKQSDFERDSERNSARNAKVLSNPTTLVRALAPSAHAGAAFSVLPNTKKRARAVISSAKWLRGTPEQRFRAASGYGARPSSDFERKARPVRCFRMLSAWLVALWLPESSGEFTIKYIQIYLLVLVDRFCNVSVPCLWHLSLCHVWLTIISPHQGGLLSRGCQSLCQHNNKAAYKARR